MRFTGASSYVFGNDNVEHENWPCTLNVEAPAKEYRGKYLRESAGRIKVKVDKRHRRLGIQLRNNKRNHIRIAPMKVCDMPEIFLSQRIGVVERWIKNTLSQAKLSSIPAKFSLVKEMERPWRAIRLKSYGLNLILMKICGMTRLCGISGTC